MSDEIKNETGTVDTSTTVDSGRRDFLKSTSLGAIATGSLLTGLVSPQKALADDFSALAYDRSLAGKRRINIAYYLRKRAAKIHWRTTRFLPIQRDNNDENRYRRQHFYANFSKTLPHDQFGDVSSDAYTYLRKALRTGKQSHFNRIPLDNSADRFLANPQGAFRFTMVGLDSHATRMPAAPEFRSAKTAAEMGEVYWLAHTRDVPFNQYASNGLIADAIDDLNLFSETVGPKQGGNVTTDTVFRGETPGDLNGPYISQFLYKDIPYGPSTIEQRYEIPTAGVNFMLDPGNWLNVQRGGTPAESASFDSTLRYIYNNRALSEYVHRDVSCQAYFNAAFILMGFGENAVDTNNPYHSISNQESFTTFGEPFVLDILTQAANLAFSGAWFQKWRVHRRLRPEAYGGRIHFHMSRNRNYEFHSDILNSDAINKTFSDNGSYFLPMAYTEGSPTHPSYPAGHGAVAGACCTILKACFNEDFIIPNAVEANSDGSNLTPYADSDLTVGDEINKLAANIALGRDAAGVHYRSDGINGIAIGEQQAIALLQDYSLLVNEDFDGFKLTKFDGTAIRIKDGRIF